MKITVFTPTYNRGYILHNLYESLKRQNYRNFEWLIVDDGSNDNTEELVNRWILEDNDFSIRYYKKDNGGKCSAINFGLDLAKGQLFFTVDSDDYLTDDALYKIIKWERTLPKDKQYCGVAGNLGFSKDQTPNSLFLDDYYDGDLLDRYRNVDGERAFVFYTDIHRKYKYPIFENEKFMTEAVVWNRMANDDYKMRYYNDIIWIYEYRNDGLTSQGNSLFIHNPKGYGLWIKERVKFMHLPLPKILSTYYSFTCEMHENYKCKLIAEFLNIPVIIIYVFNFIHKMMKIKS